jgi:hypothetical protein
VGPRRSGHTRRCTRDLPLGQADPPFYMLYAYTKQEQGDLTLQQAKVLRRLVREEFK